MAQVQTAPPNVTFIDKRFNPKSDTGLKLGTLANYASNASLDTRLLALGYTQATLDKMTQNDKVYALRLKDDAGSL